MKSKKFQKNWVINKKTRQMIMKRWGKICPFNMPTASKMHAYNQSTMIFGFGKKRWRTENKGVNNGLTKNMAGNTKIITNIENHDRS